MKFIVDRIEGNYAVIEVGSCTEDIHLRLLPEGIKEGDIVEIKILEEETKIRKEYIENKYIDLWEDYNG